MVIYFFTSEPNPRVDLKFKGLGLGRGLKISLKRHTKAGVYVMAHIVGTKFSLISEVERGLAPSLGRNSQSR